MLALRSLVTLNFDLLTTKCFRVLYCIFLDQDLSFLLAPLNRTLQYLVADTDTAIQLLSSKQGM